MRIVFAIIVAQFLWAIPLRDLEATRNETTEVNHQALLVPISQIIYLLSSQIWRTCILL